ncbi:type I secretion protein [Jannaschia sp. AI_61]|nr:type I secretion protein [Jannaschia sp. AI_61]
MLTGSIYMLQVYDRVLASGSVPTLVVLFAIVVVLFGFLGVYDFLRLRLLSRAALYLDHRLGALAFRRGLAAVPEAEATQDLATLRSFLSGPAVTALADLPFVPLFLGVLFLIHPWLGLLTLAGAGVGVVIALVNRALTQSTLRDSAATDGQEARSTTQSRRNGEVIQAMGMQDAVTDRWARLHDAALADAQRGSDPSEALTAASRAFRMLLQSAILTVGALLVLRGDISGGMIIAGSVLAGRVLAPVDQIVGQWRITGRAAAAHHRLRHIFAETPSIVPPVDLPLPSGEITVDGLTKLGRAQSGGDRPAILTDLDFDLTAGDGLGIIGTSASGKSTLARLLVGAIAADAGEVRLDGATLDQWDPARLGRSIGYLPQTVEMLPGSLRDNIARFDPEARDAEVIAAAKLVGIHDMILRLPDGYATQLGGADQSVHLSGGQMQRLGLARAVYGCPKLVVLDEPNANLDSLGEAALTEAIRRLRAAGSTVIVIAHRDSVLQAVNKVMVLEGGTIKTMGTREAVLRGQADMRVQGAPDDTSHAHHVSSDGGQKTALRRVPVPARAAPEITALPRTVRRAGPPHRRYSA